MLGVTTKTDIAMDEWLTGDEVIRLREWGGERKCMLPLPPYEEVVIGTGDACWFRLDDRRVSREHARLTRDQEKWLLCDLGSKNGVPKQPSASGWHRSRSRGGSGAGSCRWMSSHDLEGENS